MLRGMQKRCKVKGEQSDPELQKSRQMIMYTHSFIYEASSDRPESALNFYVWMCVCLCECAMQRCHLPFSNLILLLLYLCRLLRRRRWETRDMFFVIRLVVITREMRTEQDSSTYPHAMYPCALSYVSMRIIVHELQCLRLRDGQI